MHDENEIERLLVSDPIEDEHRLDGKVPGAGTVRGRHDDCDAAHNEAYQGTAQSEIGSEVEAEEREIEVEKIAQPNTKGEKEKQWQALYTP
jgi:hypothetical protein